jgi:polyhydroxyalkanoate synthesis regulator phasin
MRPVAKFQMQSAGSGAALAKQVVAVVEEWAKRKFAVQGDKTVIREDGREAALRRTDETSGESTRTSFEMSEPVSGGVLRTSVVVLTDATAVRVLIHLALGTEGSGITIPTVRLRSPRFVRQILQTTATWQLDPAHDRIFPMPFRVGHSNADTFKDLLVSPLRRLPIVAVSHFNGHPITPGLPARISLEVCALAHTCELDDDATWAITREFGSQWSCFNGAARLYWPGIRLDDDPRLHPYWTYDWLLRRTDTPERATNWLRDEIGETVIEASSFLTEDDAFAGFDDALSRAHLAEIRAQAAENDNYWELAEEYAKENDGLKHEVKDQAEQIEQLGRQVTALKYALRAKPLSGTADEVPSETPPRTVAEAVASAQRRHVGLLAFPDDLDNQLRTLNESAGPPEKILRYLDTLAALSNTLEQNDGSLSRSILEALREQNIECSGESETTKGNRAARQARTWAIGGVSTYCEMHLKPSDGAHPDRCARIYFSTAPKAPRVGIGYIGRHF